MARYQAILAYDGSFFEGSQRQAKGKRTVQGELEKALAALNWRGRSVLLAGRTDAGVHASGQVCAFDLEWKHSPQELLKALNAALPSDMAARSLSLAQEDFHPRFDATSRAYCYKLFCDPVRDPLRERYAWRLTLPLNEETLHRCARILLGTRDFAAFGSPTRPNGSTTRTVFHSAWKQTLDGGWRYEIRADAFLYRMVRRLVFAQVSAAQGRLSMEQIRIALEKQETIPAGLAPAHGLTLVEVTY